MARRRNRGFTLLELVMTLVLVGLLASFATPYLGNGVRAYNHTAAALAAIDQLRYAGERIARELREIRHGDAGFDIHTPLDGNSGRIVFTRLDGVVVTLEETPPTLSLAYDTVADGRPFTLCGDGSRLRLGYYQADGVTVATDSRELAYIDFELSLDNGTRFYRRSRVALRNHP